MYITSTVLESPPFGAPLPSPTCQPGTCHGRSPAVQGPALEAGSSAGMTTAAREVTAEPLPAGGGAAGGPAGGVPASAAAAEPAPAAATYSGRSSELLRQAADEGCNILTKLTRTCRSQFQCAPLSPAFISEAKAVLLLRSTKAGQCWGRREGMAGIAGVANGLVEGGVGGHAAGK